MGKLKLDLVDLESGKGKLPYGRIPLKSRFSGTGIFNIMVPP